MAQVANNTARQANQNQNQKSEKNIGQSTKNKSKNSDDSNTFDLRNMKNSSKLTKIASKNGIDVYGAFIDTSFLSLPLLIYKNVFSSKLSINEMKQSANQLFSKNLWTDNGWSWGSGASETPHFHDNCHETLIVLNGWAKIAWGIDNNIEGTCNKGDIIFQPCGLYHCGKGCSNDCYTMGIYPKNSKMWKFEYNGPNNKQKQNISKLQDLNNLPNDPVFGDKDTLKEFVKLMLQTQKL